MLVGESKLGQDIPDCRRESVSCITARRVGNVHQSTIHIVPPVTWPDGTVKRLLEMDGVHQ